MAQQDSTSFINRWRHAGLPTWPVVRRLGILPGFAFGALFSVMYWTSADWANHLLWEKVAATTGTIAIVGPIWGLSCIYLLWKLWGLTSPRKQRDITKRCS